MTPSSTPNAPSNPSPSFLSRALRSHVPSSTAPLQGLRVLSNIAIVMCHTVAFSLIMLDVSPPAEEVLLARSGVPATILTFFLLTVSSFAVDVFLLISGFCMMAGLAKLSGDTGVGPLDKVPIRANRIPLYALGRYLRLMPVYLCVAAVTYLTGWTPCIHAEEIFFSRIARRQIRRLTTGRHLYTEPFCVIPAWSLEVDFQIQMLVLIMAAVISSWNGLQSAMLVLTMASGLYRTVTWGMATNAVPPTFVSMRDMLPVTLLDSFGNMTKLKAAVLDPHDPIHLARYESTTSFLDWYMDIFSRWGALFIGAAVWITMRNSSRFCGAVRKRPTVSLVVSGALFLAAVASLGYVSEGTPSSAQYLAFGFYRILCVLSLGIIVILTCSVGTESTETEGRQVRALKNFLGARVFLWLSRSAYVVFLIHPVAAFSLAWFWPRLTKDTLRSELLIIGALRWYLVSVLMSIPFCIIEEAGLTIRGRVLQYFGGMKSKPLLTEDKTHSKDD